MVSISVCGMPDSVAARFSWACCSCKAMAVAVPDSDAGAVNSGEPVPPCRRAWRRASS
ncbi:hypothetical protein D3C86_1961800 [compost metagenome]